MAVKQKQAKITEMKLYGQHILQLNHELRQLLKPSTIGQSVAADVIIGEFQTMIDNNFKQHLITAGFIKTLEDGTREDIIGPSISEGMKKEDMNEDQLKYTEIVDQFLYGEFTYGLPANLTVQNITGEFVDPMTGEKKNLSQTVQTFFVWLYKNFR